MIHRGPALVFDSVEDIRSQIDGENFEVTADTSPTRG
jgi:hypothetical protein